MRLFDRLRLAVEMLGALKLPTLQLSTAQARYDPMVQSLADALAAEFGVTWTEEQEAELDQAGRHWDYTTKVLVADQPLDVFPDWSSRYERVVESVAQVSVLGTYLHDDTKTRSEANPTPPDWPAHQTFGDIELKSLDEEDFGPSRATQDAVGGDIEMDIYEGRTHIQISVKVAATS